MIRYFLSVCFNSILLQGEGHFWSVKFPSLPVIEDTNGCEGEEKRKCVRILINVEQNSRGEIRKKARQSTDQPIAKVREESNFPTNIAYHCVWTWIIQGLNKKAAHVYKTRDLPHCKRPHCQSLYLKTIKKRDPPL